MFFFSFEKLNFYILLHDRSLVFPVIEIAGFVKWNQSALLGLVVAEDFK